MKILGFDSGMDLVAGALVDTSRCPGRELAGDFDGFARAAHGLERIITIRTPPGYSTVERCRMIRDGLQGEILELVDVVLIEVPAFDGRNARARKEGENAIVADVSKLNRSIGAISAAVEARQVLEVAAPRGRKDLRRPRVDAALRRAGKPAARNGDEADALWHTLTAAAAVLRNPRHFEACTFRGLLYESAEKAAGARAAAQQKEAQRAARRPAPRKKR